MTAGRKPLKPATLHGPDFVTATPPEMAAQEAAARALVRSGAPTPTEALARQLGYEGPLAPDLLEEGARESLTRINFEIFSVGARLALIKEQSAHGEFMGCLERLDIEKRMAQRLIQATRKFPNALTLTLLSTLGKSKIFELAMLDDEEAEAFANGEEVRGITQDDAYRMSVSELRAALRLERADKEAEIAKARAEVSGQLAGKDRLLADSKKRIAELVEEKNKRESHLDSEREDALEERLAKATFEAVAYMHGIRAAVDAIRGLERTPQGLYVSMQAALHRVITEAESIATDYGISLAFGLPTMPAADNFDVEALADLDDPNADEDFGPDYQAL